MHHHHQPLQYADHKCLEWLWGKFCFSYRITESDGDSQDKDFLPLNHSPDSLMITTPFHGLALGMNHQSLQQQWTWLPFFKGVSFKNPGVSTQRSHLPSSELPLVYSRSKQWKKRIKENWTYVMRREKPLILAHPEGCNSIIVQCRAAVQLNRFFRCFSRSWADLI